MARSKRRRALLALACATPLLAACNAILGISDFEKDTCSGGGTACLGDSGLPDVVTEGGVDAGPDVGRIDATGAAAVSWIQKPMPNYPGFPSTDVPEASVPVYSDTTGGGVKDLLADRVWRPVATPEKAPNPAKRFADAKKFCEGITGEVKWRLPTRIELVSLLDFSKLNERATAAEKFNIDPEIYWTSSEVRQLLLPSTFPVVTTKFWAVNFKPAEAEFMQQLDTAGASPATARVICVQDI